MDTIEFYIGAYDLSPLVTGLDYIRDTKTNSALVRVHLGILTLKKTQAFDRRLRPIPSTVRHENHLSFNPVYISFAGYVVTLRGVYHGAFQTELCRIGEGKRPNYYRFSYFHRNYPIVDSDGRLVPDMRLSHESS